jgi:hypothetical protein
MRATKQAEVMPQVDFFLDISKSEELNMIGRRIVFELTRLKARRYSNYCSKDAREQTEKSIMRQDMRFWNIRSGGESIENSSHHSSSILLDAMAVARQPSRL